MEHLVHWISDLLYSLLCCFMQIAVALFFIVIAIQFITKGRIDAGRAIGTVSKIAGSVVKLVTSRGKRRR